MKELRNAKFRPPNPAKDSAGLAALAGMLNAHAGVVAPKENLPGAAAIKVAPKLEEPTRTLPATSPATAPVPATNLNRVFVTGRLKTGKDHVLTQAGFRIHALADPLYHLAEYFFGKQPKDAMRVFLQTVGNWGRGLVSADYGLTPERAIFCQTVRDNRSEFDAALKVDWAAYGRNENLWLDALVARVNAEPAGTRVAVSGVRFNNEVARLTAEGFVSFHCLCSPATWSARLKQVGLTPESSAAKDVSEYLAASLDASVTKTLSQQPRGNKLRCIFSDSNAPSPSPRLLTVPEFVALFPK